MASLISSRRSSLVGEAAAIASLALATLEGIAHTSAGTSAPRSRHLARLVGVAAAIATLALATVEGEADASGLGLTGLASRSGVSSLVGEAAAIATLALATLEGIAHTRCLLADRGSVARESRGGGWE